MIRQLLKNKLDGLIMDLAKVGIHSASVALAGEGTVFSFAGYVGLTSSSSKLNAEEIKRAVMADIKAMADIMARAAASKKFWPTFGPLTALPDYEGWKWRKSQAYWRGSL